MIYIGIDPSINCTGICVWDTDNNTNIYFMIPSKMTKKMTSFKSDYVVLCPYEKGDYKDLEYSSKESVKFDNIYKICNNIKSVISSYRLCDVEVVMEGVSYGSTGSAALVDLSFLNSAIRMTLKELNIPFTIVSPTSLKKFACANGSADKEVIVDAWKRLDSNIYNITDIKVDDLADAFFLSHYNISDV